MNLKNTSSCGLDGLSTSHFKACSDYIAAPIAELVNDSFREGCFPRCLKLSKITPVYKSGDKTKLTNYRPISVLPTLAKIFEAAAVIQITNYIERNSILSPRQYGFRARSSTSSALFDLVSTIQVARDAKETALAIFVDLKKAFDAVDRKILIHKLAGYGFLGDFRNWIMDYLNGRGQVVSQSGVVSDVLSCEAGVPQGSRLGPILFLLFMNDIDTIGLEGQLYMYADDLCILHAGPDGGHLYDAASRDLRRLSQWAHQNRVTVNPSKTKFMVFGEPHANRTLCLENTQLECASQFRYLGVTLDAALSFTCHVDRLIGRLSAITGAVRRGIGGSPPAVRMMIYKSLFEPTMSYGVLAWSATSQENIKRVQVAQNKFLRLILNLDICEINLKDPALLKDTAHRKNILKALSSRYLPDIDIQITHVPVAKRFCPSSVAKYFSDRNFSVELCSTVKKESKVFPGQIPKWTFAEDDSKEDFQEKVVDFIEFIGFLSLDCSTTGDDYLNSYTYSWPMECVSKVTVRKWKGMFTKDMVKKVFNYIW
ncbi:hypothetical protein DMENIID0001_132420 [Sergentomyia squamirostris]